MTSSRRIDLLLTLLPLFAGCARSRRPFGDELVERAELRDAWTMTLVWFGVVVVLVLALIVMRQRRKPLPILNGLFRSRRFPDVRQWQRERAEAALRRRDDRATRRQAEKVASAAALAAERAAMLLQPKLGPPTIGLGRRFLIAFYASGAMALLYALRLAAMLGEYAIFAIVFGGIALVVALVTSFLCAALMTLLPRHHPVIGAACGALTACGIVPLVPPPFGLDAVALIGAGVFMGVMVGIAEQTSRMPLMNPSADESPRPARSRSGRDDG